MTKPVVAVFYGAKSFEHDVSILTGLEAYFCIDTTRYTPIPVYIDIEGNWWTGDDLLQRRNYPLSAGTKRRLGQTTLMVGNGKPFLRVKRRAILTHTTDIHFDCALLAFHGDYGEDGGFQGLFEALGIPYTGTRMLASSAFMNKRIAKRILRTFDVPVLDDIFIPCPPKGKPVDIDALTKDIKVSYPVIVKPNALGSSVGLTKAKTKADLKAGLLKIFAMGADALIEECIENLQEFNVSVTNCLGKETRCSAIERPHPVDDDAILDFSQKYLGGVGKCGKLGGGKLGGGKLGGGKLGGAKMGVGMAAGGLLAMTRDLNPKDLSAKEADAIRTWAIKAYEALLGTGVVRIDFLCDTKKRKFYLNEVNTIPGSLSFYLWVAAKPAVIYTDLLSGLIEQAFDEYAKRQGRTVTLTESKIFGRN